MTPLWSGARGQVRETAGRHRAPFKLTRLGLVGLVAALATPAWASGSVGPGKVSVPGRADYSRGKAIVFNVLVCRTCPLTRRAFNRTRAVALKEAFAAALEAGPRLSPDPNVQRVCQAPRPRRRGRNRGSEGCATRVKQVIAYLDRRFRL